MKLENSQHYRRLEEKLGKVQRARKGDRTRALHARIKNKRKDAIHRFTAPIVKENAFIVVGNASVPAWLKPKWQRLFWMQAGLC